MKKITKNEFILEVLKDELKSGKNQIFNKCKELIKNPNLENEEENFIRSKLICSNGAIRNLLDRIEFSEFYQFEIDEKEFLELFWCPNPGEEDGIDIMTNGTRELKDILSYLESPSMQHEKIIRQMQEYFNETTIPPVESRRLFLFDTCNKKHIQDGNHRAGAILRELSKGNKDIFPIKVYLAKKKQKNI